MPGILNNEKLWAGGSILADQFPPPHTSVNKGKEISPDLDNDGVVIDPTDTLKEEMSPS